MIGENGPRDELQSLQNFENIFLGRFEQELKPKNITIIHYLHMGKRPEILHFLKTASQAHKQHCNQGHTPPKNTRNITFSPASQARKQHCNQGHKTHSKNTRNLFDWLSSRKIEQKWQTFTRRLF